MDTIAIPPRTSSSCPVVSSKITGDGPLDDVWFVGRT